MKRYFVCKRIVNKIFIFILFTTIIFNTFILDIEKEVIAINTITIGMLRYDTKTPGWKQNETYLALQPKVWGDMGYWPTYSKINPDGSLDDFYGGDDMTAYQENNYAHESGIDYWIFIDWPNEYDSSFPRNEYLVSGNKSLVKFSTLINVYKDINNLKYNLDLMLDSQWIRVLNNRPLLYIYNSGKPIEEGGFVTSDMITFTRNYVQNTLGLPNPYIVLFDDSVKGEDAFSQYATGCQTNLIGADYGDLISSVSGLFSAQASNHNNYVPNAVHNWDNRPWYSFGRTENPPYWTVPPTTEEYRQMLQTAVNFTLLNPNKCPAMTIISKEWNGMEEGGNVNPSIRHGSEAIDAIKLVNKSSVINGAISDDTVKNIMEYRVFNGNNLSITNKYNYKSISDKPYIFAEGDIIEYDVYLDDFISGAGGIDIKCTDGSYFRQYAFIDQNGIQGVVGTNSLAPFAYKRWFKRKLTVPSYLVGKTAEKWLLVGENDLINQTYYTRYDSIMIKDSNDKIKETIFTDSDDLNNVGVDDKSDTGDKLIKTNMLKSNPVNLLKNAGFESGLLNWTKSGVNLGASYVQSPGRTGNYELSHWSSQQYVVTTKQALQNLPFGRYTLRAWIKSSSQLGNTAKLYVETNGSKIEKTIPYCSQYQMLIIPDIYVTEGDCIIGFESINSQAYQWFCVDDIEFNLDSGYSETTPGKSNLNNSGFESGMTGWITGGSNPEANYVQAPGRTGNYELAHWKSSTYSVNTYQNINDLQDGEYTMLAWVKSSDMLGESATMYATSNGIEHSYKIPYSQNYRKIVIPNINVSGGECTIGFKSNQSPGNQWFCVDDVLFYPNSQNLAVNGNFDAGVTGWSTRGEHQQASYLQYSQQRSGDSCRAHWYPNNYSVTTYQTISNLTTGRYGMSAWVRSSGSMSGQVRMYALPSGGQVQGRLIPFGYHYQRLIIDNILVTNGICEIGFESISSPANSWYVFDDVEFVKID